MREQRLAQVNVNQINQSTVYMCSQGTEGPWAAAFAQAMSGSPGLYSQTEPAEGEWWANNGGRKWKGGRAPAASINFVTAHDGFSLADLTAYNEKHNDANGEDNRSVMHTSCFYTVHTVCARFQAVSDHWHAQPVTCYFIGPNHFQGR